MPPPQDPNHFSPVILAAAAITMTTILEEWPELGDYGFGVVYDPRHKTTAAERDAALAKERQQIQRPEALAAFIVARKWIARQPRRKTLNRTGTSYGLKHVAEREIGYLTNGVFIAAAIAEGFRVGRITPDGIPSPNAYLNIGNRAWTPT